MSPASVLWLFMVKEPHVTCFFTVALRVSCHLLAYCGSRLTHLRDLLLYCGFSDSKGLALLASSLWLLRFKSPMISTFLLWLFMFEEPHATWFILYLFLSRLICCCHTAKLNPLSHPARPCRTFANDLAVSASEVAQTATVDFKWDMSQILVSSRSAC